MNENLGHFIAFRIITITQGGRKGTMDEKS